MEPGLHHLMHPAGMKRVRQYSSLRVLHFGFSTDLNILNKFQTYQQAGQRGRNLWRLVDESDLVLEDIFKHSKYLGSRYPKFARSIKEDSYDQISSLLIEKCYFQKNEIHHDKSPIVTLISLIYSGVDWLEFQYGELLKLQNELGQGEVEILFVANDASKEVLDFLKQNLIPYIISPGKKYVDEWYINSVYRAYNFGVELSQGGYVLLTNSDMSYRPGFLIDMLKHRSQNSYLVAKLIESGRLTPAKAAIKKNLGKKLTTFRRRAFYAFSSKMLQEGKSPGGLFMPLLVSRKSFLEAGGYPEGNIHGDSLNNYLRSGVYTLALQGDPLFPGDFAFVKRLEMNDWKHETLTSSIAYHFQEGEKSETRRSARAVIRSGIRMKIENSLLEGKIQCPTINKVSRPRLTIIDSLDKIENKGKYIWLTNDFELFEKIDPRKLRNIQAIITSSALVLKHSAITFNIHTYYVENLMNEKMFDLVRVLEEILALELRNSFLPVEPKPLRLIITEKIPSPLKRVIKSIPVFSR
jgi:hypothetical protein